MQDLLALLPLIGKFLLDLWLTRKERQREADKGSFDAALADGDSDVLARLLSQL